MPRPVHELRPDGSQAISPDGARLAFVAADASGVESIWIRGLDEINASRLEGTDGGAGPFWSPDGSSLGYFAGGQLRVLDLRNGTRRVLCPTPRPGGATWSPSGTIVYGPDFLAKPLYKVPAAGGDCTQLTHYRPGDFDHRRPSALPDGKRVLFSSYRANVALAADIETGAITEVRKPGDEAQFVAPDSHALPRRVRAPWPAGRGVLHQLDMRTLQPIGEPRVVLDRVVGVGGMFRFSATQRVFVGLHGSSKPRSLLWVNGQSAIVDSIVAASRSGAARRLGRLRRVARRTLGRVGRSGSVAARARPQRRRARARRDDAEPGDHRSVVEPGGLTHRLRDGVPRSADAAGLSRADGSVRLAVLARTSQRAHSRLVARWKRIAFLLAAGDTVLHDEIWVYSLAERRATRAFETTGNARSPRWSPDGRWMAYMSDVSGAPAVYLRRMDGLSEAVPVSSGGGDFPRWRRDGRELYYRAPGGEVMAVSVTLGETAVLSKPRVVVSSPPFNRTTRELEVTPDGAGFVAYGREDPAMFTVMTDWVAKLTDK